MVARAFSNIKQFFFAQIHFIMQNGESELSNTAITQLFYIIVFDTEN